MTNKLIKNLMLVLTMVVLCFAVGTTASAEDRTVVDSGECGAQGDNVIWTLYDDGELVISGEGEMEDYITIQSDTLHNYNETPWYLYSEDIKSVMFDLGVTHIGKGSFWYRHNNIKNIVISDSIVTIDMEAFSGCNSLETVIIGSGVMNIAENTFLNCNKLMNISVSENNNYYCNDKNGVLFNKEMTVLIQYPAGNQAVIYTIPDTVTTIEKEAFKEAIFLEKVSVPSSVISIKEGAFEECYNLANIILPKSVLYIEKNAFAKCFSLCEITLDSSLKFVGTSAFSVLPFVEKVYVRGINTVFEKKSLCANEFAISQISKNEFIKNFIQAETTNDKELYESIWADLEKHIVCSDDVFYTGTIYCHAGSTAEAYAIENGVDYVLTHFYEGEWIYDYDNMIKYRKCIHCDELETEQLEATENEEDALPKEDFFSKLFAWIEILIALILSIFK